MDPGGNIYTTDQFRCWKVENLDNESSDENKNEVGRYRVVSPQKLVIY
jgi:ribosomal protein S25